MVTQAWLEAAAYPNPTDAQEAVQGLRMHNFAETAISLLYTDTGHTLKAGLIDGAIWGGVLGGLVGLLFPPAGLLIAAGPILGILTSGAELAVIGAVTVSALETVVSGLVHLGMPKEVATTMGQHIHKGDALVVVHANSAEQAQLARTILEAHHPRSDDLPSTTGVVSVAPPA